jgi:hypothetical protein
MAHGTRSSSQNFKELSSQIASETKSSLVVIGQTLLEQWHSGSRRLALLFKTDQEISEQLPQETLETVVLRSGELELIASHDQPVQAVVGFNFNAAVTPSRRASSVGGTYKFFDPDGDGQWTALVKMPEVTGQFRFNTEIAYADGQSKQINSNVLIDPEGYVFERHQRGELRIAEAVVTLWQKRGTTWEKWLGEKYNQSNPQVTDKTGQYAFLAPAGEYYLEVTARDYEANKSQPFTLTTASPIHQAIELKYIGK